MKIYVVRHGEAVPASEHPDRPLSEAGRRDVARTADVIHSKGGAPRTVFHSGKARARETAEIIAARTDGGRPVIERAGLDPNDPVAPIMSECVSGGEDVMLVGHLPFVGRLAGLAVTGHESETVVEFDAGAVACMEDAGEGWRLAWFYSPRREG